jgi:hypothetical protein
MKELLRKLVQAEMTVQKPDEYIEISNVEKAVEYYKNIIPSTPFSRSGW